MLKTIILLILIGHTLKAFSQDNTQLIITSTLTTDWSFDKNGKSFLANQRQLNRVTYSFDSLSKKMATTYYEDNNFYGVWDSDTLIKRKLKKKKRKFSKQLTLHDFGDILIQLLTDIDSLEKDMMYLHTSHYYPNIYIDLIQGSDTLNYHKSQPFGFLLPWTTNQRSGSILNPKIDFMIASLLPKKFLLRAKLLQIH